VGSGGTGRLVQ